MEVMCSCRVGTRMGISVAITHPTSMVTSMATHMGMSESKTGLRIGHERRHIWSHQGQTVVMSG